jgi:predicted branched-subunit amino acid permease
VVLCYVPVSFAIGLVAAQSQFSLWQAVLFSVLAYSGSGQSIGLQLLALGQPVLSIASTAAVVNLRYFLFNTTLAPRIAAWPAVPRYLFAFTVTDETFAIHSSEFRRGTPPLAYALAVNLACWTAWVSGTALGHVAGSLVSDTRRYGLDFAVPGMFVALVVLQIENRLYLCLAALGAALAVALRCSPLSDWAVLVAGVVTATVGAGVDTWIRARR